MSRRGLVISALLLGLAGFGLRLLLVFWWQPLMWRLDGMKLFVGFALGLAVAIAVPAAAWFVAFWLHWRKIRPGIVEMRAGRFVVPNSPAYGGSQFVLFMVNAGGLVPTERVPGHDTMRIYADPALLIVSIGTLAVFLLVAVTFLFWPKPRIELTPACVEFHYFLSRRAFKWEELAPGGPQAPSRFQKLSVLVRGPRGGWMPTTVPAIVLAERGFIASLIRHYADHPAYRAGIGTAAEHARLVGPGGPLRSPSGDPAHQPGYAPAIVDRSS
ncbi:MAG: hypothetical protein HOU81_11300 [Hamadaea sp.]|uniref:hypothetical protein n=1 Tax=Hamadaea sp. TaxID=2024425 RepID=UPI0017D62F4C|nr:hypothetical protein [Hamadaea sp.]NUR71398.1 hypothetical protein [Hamadaea sp.]NUT22695.1 hypothetical protein [Hamadaea sp.]